jgi:hypothetical protein
MPVARVACDDEEYKTFGGAASGWKRLELVQYSHLAVAMK